MRAARANLARGFRDAFACYMIQRRTRGVWFSDQLLAHLSPLGWEHVNLTGDYVWGNQQDTSENTVGLRPLRATPEITRQAA
jgi:Tn3 transposase DDE domain